MENARQSGFRGIIEPIVQLITAVAVLVGIYFVMI